MSQYRNHNKAELQKQYILLYQFTQELKQHIRYVNSETEKLSNDQINQADLQKRLIESSISMTAIKYIDLYESLNRS